MKISEVVAEILDENGMTRVFGVSGGASLHLLKAVSDHPKLSLTCLHHEQSVAMAAEAYSRISNSIGVGIVTSGPGATNLLTGIAGAFFDSIPVVYVTGQVSTTRMKREKNVRQIGFQETPIVDIVKPITKYAVTIENPESFEYEFRKAIDIARSGRKGPVLIDIPDDIQRQDIVFLPKKKSTQSSLTKTALDVIWLDDIKIHLKKSLRPIIVCGAGIQLTSKRNLVIKQLYRLGIPTAVTWGAKDLLPGDSSFLLGTFGTHGERFVNLALQNADLIISIGSRLDLKATGTPVASFAPKAKKIMFDVDISEIQKFNGSGLAISVPANIDFENDVFDSLIKEIEFDSEKLKAWKLELELLKTSLPRENRVFLGPGVNPYLLIEKLSDALPNSSNLVIDTGCAVAWTMQVWKTKLNQRIFHDFNNTAMGWSIPATIASVLSNPDKTHLCLVGDGSIMMALSDLSSLSNLAAPIKIIILNNSGYAMIKQTQDQWFNSSYFASNSKDDLIFPKFSKIAEANGFEYHSISMDSEIDEKIELVLRETNPLICEVFIQEAARVIPIVKFGNANYIMDPDLIDNFNQNLKTKDY